jgi:hypothetical protein
MNESAAIVPAATARSCEPGHFGKPAGSGVGVGAAAGERVAAAVDGVALIAAVGVATMVAGAAQDTSVIARSKRSIVRR